MKIDSKKFRNGVSTVVRKQISFLCFELFIPAFYHILGKYDIRHYREPFNLLHPMFCASYFSSHISLSLPSTIQIAHVSWRRQLEGTKPVEAKERVTDSESCESEELLQSPILL